MSPREQLGFDSRRCFGALAAALLAFSACGKKKDASRIETPAFPASAEYSALVDTITSEPRALPGTQTSEVLPAWALEPAHFFNRGGRRFASAVGRAEAGDFALARTAAEDRARVDLLKLLEGAGSKDAVEGSLPGARMTNSFTSKRGGQVFVRVEVEAAKS
jgi:hypothetical protein